VTPPAWARVAAGGLLAAAAAAAGLGLAKDTKEELRRDLKDDAVVGDWNYDDIDGAFARAVREKKPVCIVFR
jgi:hypothetical protein